MSLNCRRVLQPSRLSRRTGTWPASGPGTGFLMISTYRRRRGSSLLPLTTATIFSKRLHGEGVLRGATDDNHVRRINSHVRQALEERARDGKVTVDVRRWYYVGNKN